MNCLASLWASTSSALQPARVYPSARAAARSRCQQRRRADAGKRVRRAGVLLEHRLRLDGRAGARGQQLLVGQPQRGDRLRPGERDRVLRRDQEGIDHGLGAVDGAGVGAEHGVDEVQRVKAEAA